MKFIPLMAVVFALLCNALQADQDTYEIYKATISLPVNYQTTDKNNNPIVKTITLKNDDVINLSFGKALSTPVDHTTWVLVLAGDASTPGVDSFIGVYNLKFHFVAPVFPLPTFIHLYSGDNYQKNTVFAEVDVPPTTTGDPTHFGFLDSTFYMGGGGTRKDSGKLAVSAKSICGALNFVLSDNTNTPTTYNGIIVNGKFTVEANFFATASLTPP